jgi:PAS domain S-box-containing protein
MDRPAEPTVALSGDVSRQLRAVHRLTVALHQADSPLAFYEEAVAAVVDLLGVDRASLLLFDPDGVMRFKAWRGLSRNYRQAVEGHTPWSPQDAGAAPILVGDVEADDDLAAYWPVLKAEGIRALAFVPLVHRDRLVGKFMLYYGEPHTFAAAEIAGAEILAGHVALALERRLAEEALRRHEEHLQLALAAGEMGTWEWEIPTGSVTWSPTLERLHGLAPGTFPGTFEAFQADVHPDDRTRVLTAIGAVVESPGQDTYSATYRIVAPDGSTRWVSASGQLLRDEEGRPQWLLGVCGDVTERERLLGAERASVARLRSLQRVTAGLSRAVTVADVADVVLGVALAELGASTGALCLVDGDHLEIVDAFGYPDDVMTHWRRFPLADGLPASDAVRTGQAVFLTSHDDRDERYPVFAATPAVPDEAFAMMPLTDGEPLGCLVLGFSQARQFSVEDRRFFDTLAGQCAAALGRAALYEERERARRTAEEARQAAERSRDRLAFLAEASALLAASLDPQETFERLAEGIVPRLADWCAIYLLDEHRVVPAAITHSDPARLRSARQLVARYPVRITDSVGAGAVIRTGEAEVLPEIDDEVLANAASTPEHLQLIRQLDLGASVTIPLAARGKTIGALSLVNGQGRDFDDDSVALAGELARRAATAIDNARLFAQRTDIARTLQASLLPPELPTISGLELAARYVAGGAGVDVGGDFYDVFPLDEHRFLAVLGDVRGRGVEAATLAALCRHAIRSAAITLGGPEAILQHLNEVVLRQVPDGSDEPRFCTALVAVVDQEGDGRVAVTLAVGGHPLPFLCDRSGDIRPVGTPGSLIGALPEVAVTEERFRVAPGQTLICYTDGMTERRSGTAFFGDEALAAVLAEAANNDADTVAANLEAAVLGFADGDLSDDLALLVLRVPPRTATAARHE